LFAFQVEKVQVYDIPDTDPLMGSRVTLVNPDILAQALGSPLGWNCQEKDNCYTTTIGNNVYAQTNPTGGSRFVNFFEGTYLFCLVGSTIIDLMEGRN
jgi:hypothetical protein